jgi:hypothetical protein
MKTVLFTLLKAFKFQLGVPGSEIEADSRYDMLPLHILQWLTFVVHVAL